MRATLETVPDPHVEYDDDYDQGPAELEEPDCDDCYGEGGDPLNDFCLPCPKCGR